MKGSKTRAYYRRWVQSTKKKLEWVGIYLSRMANVARAKRKLELAGIAEKGLIELYELLNIITEIERRLGVWENEHQ